MAETRRIDQTLPPDLPAVDPERELPASTTRSNPRLNEAAEAIGGALGSASRQAQNVRDRLTVIPGGASATTEQVKERAQHKMEEIKERASSAVEQARIKATAKLEDARVTASRLVQNARDSAAVRARVVRYRAARLADERPLAVLGGIAGAAFLAGVFLRVRRGKRG